MLAELQVTNKLKVTASGDNPLELFKELSTLQEIFGEGSCKKCIKDKKPGTNLTYRIREVPDGKKVYTYPELVCQDCWAKFTFGQSDEGALFPVRYLREGKEYKKDADGKNIPKGEKGWVRYNKDTGKEE